MSRELQALYDISQVSGKGSAKIKAEILKRNFNPDMEYLLNVAFNPLVTTKLSKIDIIESDLVQEFKVDEYKEIMEILINRKSANDELRELVGRYLGALDLSPELLDIIINITIKNLVIGIKSSSVNKAIGRTVIPDMSLMLAKNEPERMKSWKKIFCEMKYDGVRLVAIVKNGDVRYYTRKFNEADSKYLTRITEGLKKIFDFNSPEPFFIDGELTMFVRDRKGISGEFNKVLKDTASIDIDEQFVFNIFDFGDYTWLEEGQGDVIYTTRRKSLEDLFNKQSTISRHIRLAESYEVNSIEDVDKVYEILIEQGAEGVICKSDSVYECKRSSEWIKFKEEADCDLKVVGWTEGENKREGYIGALICESADGLLKVNVGSGFSDNDLEIMNDRIKNDDILNKIVVVRYNEKITDKHGNISLFLPRFIEIREDKDMADYEKDIK